jgi:hypothetical protein
MIVKRRPSAFSVHLWVDIDDYSYTNLSSVVALQPVGGFTGLVTEAEGFCFYDKATWPFTYQNNLTLPPGC